MHRSFVTAADWDGDRVPDLLWLWSGRRQGIGVALGPFQAGPPLDLVGEVEFAPRPTTADEYLQDMTVVDWDRDGKPDLLALLWLDGGKSGIYWYRNVGEKGLKHLAPGALQLGESELGGAAAGTRKVDGFAAGDWDGDGWPDLFVARQDLVPPASGGGWLGSTWLYRRE